MTEFVSAVRPRGVRLWLPLGLLATLLLGFLFLPIPFLEKLRALSAGVCAQRIGHSLLYGGVQPPLESRMIGIYGGFAVAVLALALAGRGRANGMAPIWLLIVSLLGIAVMGFDGTNALLYDLRLPHAYPPNNILRLITGTYCGLGVAILILPIFNFTVWKSTDTRPIVGSALGLLGLVAAEVAFIAIALTGFGFLLYPISILSVGGVVLLLFAVNLLVALGVLRREGQATSPLELIGPGSVALSLTTVELLVLAAMRFWAEATLGITPL
jgi:uncharacterized membrane protein